MSTDIILEQAKGKLRIALGVFGLVAIAAGIAIMVWPAATAKVITAIMAVYVIVAGLAYVGAGFFTTGMAFWARFWRLIVGVLFVVAGVVALGSLATTAAFFFVFMAIMIGVTWIFEGFMAFSNLSRSSSKGWTIFYAVMSIAAGLLIVFAPIYSTIALWWLLGLSLIIFGVVQVIQAFRN